MHPCTRAERPATEYSIRRLASSWPQFRAEEKGRRNQHGSRHAGPYASGPAFRSGEPVKETGIYEVTHQVEHRAEHEVVLLSGDTFPRCETCQSEVAFRMIRTAPYIFQDADFEES